jgi:soluble lytic murein transglycosylase-like protein
MSSRARWTVAGTATAVVLAGAVILLARGGSAEPQAGRSVSLAESEPSSVVVSTMAVAAVPTTATTATTSPVKPTTTSRKPAAKKAPMPAPTAHPVDVAVPPPPHPAPVPGCAPSFVGANAAKADVKAALLAAAGRQYWANASNPPLVAIDPPEGGPTPTPEQTGPRAVITVPPALIEAVAWQESGWQSAIRSCDGGVGTMQVMGPTATWMNQRFGTGHDHTTLAGNAAIGAEYLEWLIAYFGENNFGHHYDITDPDLLTAVLVGYNAGPGAVQFTGGHTVASRYATTVKALMSSQPWG